jgi:transposase
MSLKVDSRVSLGSMTVGYELSEGQWSRIKDLLPGRKESVGRTAGNHRAFVNGVLWVLRSGARWSDLPERYGKHKTVHKRFTRWAATRVWDQIFRTLTKDANNECLMVDSTIVRAHQQAATGRQGGSDQALGRSRGGLTTKIHLLCNGLGQPVDFSITAGQVADCTQALPLLHDRTPEYVLADKGYDADSIVQYIEAQGAVPVIPPRANRKAKREYDKTLYKQRNLIERCFSKLKHFRRLATRFEKHKINFQSLAALACSTLLLA